jgi:hypothetical protein
MMGIRDDDSFEYFAYSSSALCVISPLLAGKAGGWYILCGFVSG